MPQNSRYGQPTRWGGAVVGGLERELSVIGLTRQTEDNSTPPYLPQFIDRLFQEVCCEVFAEGTDLPRLLTMYGPAGSVMWRP